jgi:hypothetical protein
MAKIIKFPDEKERKLLLAYLLGERELRKKRRNVI